MELDPAKIAGKNAAGFFLIHVTPFLVLTLCCKSVRGEMVGIGVRRFLSSRVERGIPIGSGCPTGGLIKLPRWACTAEGCAAALLRCCAATLLRVENQFASSAFSLFAKTRCVVSLGSSNGEKQAMQLIEPVIAVWCDSNLMWDSSLAAAQRTLRMTK